MGFYNTAVPQSLYIVLFVIYLIRRNLAEKNPIHKFVLIEK